MRRGENAIPNKYSASVKEVVDLSNKLKQISLGELKDKIHKIRRRWFQQIHQNWEIHCNKVFHSEAILEDWDPANGVLQHGDLIELCAIVREASRRILGLCHYEVQIAGGMALLDGHIIQMKTGEGKTIVALFPAVAFALIAQIDSEVSCASYLKRRSVHVMTTDEYLVQRDAMQLRPVYEFFGLTVGYITSDQLRLDKEISYACDVIYGTVSEFAFDYLRDNQATKLGDRFQSSLYYAIIDEVDHILIDESRTPLILSGMDMEQGKLYLNTVSLFNPLVQRLYKYPQLLLEKQPGKLEIGPLGLDAIAYAVNDFLQEPKGAKYEYTATRIITTIIEFCLQLAELATLESLSKVTKVEAKDFRDVVDSRENLEFLRNTHSYIKLETDQELILTELAIKRVLNEVTYLFESGESISSVKDVIDMVSLFRDLLKARKKILSWMQFTRDDIRALNQLLPSMLPMLFSQRIISSMSTQIVSMLQLWLTGVYKCVRNTGIQSYLVHLRSVLAIASHFGVKDIQINNFIERLQKCIKISCPDLERDDSLNLGLENLPVDTQRYWIDSFSYAINRFDERLPEQKRKGYQVLRKMLITLFASGHIDKSIDRFLGNLWRKVRGVISFPTFYTYYLGEEHIQINPMGRVIIRGFVRQLLLGDLWPGQSIGEGEELELAVDRLYPKAEEIVRLGLGVNLFHNRDEDYIVEGGEIKLVSEHTGHLLSGRRYQGLTHLFLQAKEGIKIHPLDINIARISIQQFVKKYKKFTGMSATCKLCEKELQKIYGCSVIEIPANRELIYLISSKSSGILVWNANLIYIASEEDIPQCLKRFRDLVEKDTVTLFSKDKSIIDAIEHELKQENNNPKIYRAAVSCYIQYEDVIFQTEEEKLNVAAKQLSELYRKKQPILIFAPKISTADKFAKIMSESYPEVPLNRLDARPNNAIQEAEVIAKAGRCGSVTLATQMVGRGVDIILGPKAIECGGLYILGLERRESPRLDAQVAGRCARQGDIGQCEFYLSFDDDLLRRFASEWTIKMLTWLGWEENTPICHKNITKAVRRAQTKVEENYQQQRMSCMHTDEGLDPIRTELYVLRQEILSTTHPCRGCYHGDKPVQLKISDPNIVCHHCLSEYPEYGTKPSYAVIRRVTEYIISMGIAASLEPLQIEHNLVDLYAPESFSVVEWKWNELITELSEFVGRKVKKKELCRPKSIVERVCRLKNRKRYIPNSWYHKIERMIPANANDYVDPNNEKTPWVEREYLAHRIRNIVNKEMVRNLCRIIIDPIIQTRPFKPLTAYRTLIENLSQLPLMCDPRKIIGGVEIFVVKANDLQLLRDELIECLAEYLPSITQISVDIRKKLHTLSQIQRLVKPLGIRLERHNIFNDFINASGNDWPVVLSYLCMEQIRNFYQEKIQLMGKSHVYYCESRALCKAIDKEYALFLDNFDMYTQTAVYDHIEDSRREIFVKLRDAKIQLLNKIAMAFTENLGKELYIRETQESQEAVLKLPSAIEPCICGKRRTFGECCGKIVYRGLP